MLTARVTHTTMRELSQVCRDHELLVAGRAAAELHGLAATPPVRLDLIGVRPVTDDATAEAIRDGVTAAVARTIGRQPEVAVGDRWLAVTSPPSGPQVDVTVHLVAEDLHARGWLVGSQARMSADGPTVLTLARSDIARTAGLAWWRRPDDTRLTVELGLAADRVGLGATTASWPGEPTGRHRSALLAASARTRAALPMLDGDRAEQARRGLDAITSEWTRQRRRGPR